ncbi:DNA polymerase III subunit gamma/tau [Rheinheimera baltica]|uniref:DNA polymerase III subunit gamma/tau n=1 Tax=Rheinheimera baltica TaxID=67576 RepID=UPI00273EF6E1|nr:DNA polymerase III subunit gamma/tau [Rheinheimera baltica]MDP5150300.1 DNA polymerase III subunit gamma/tau [Rheinheimera baltica]
MSYQVLARKWRPQHFAQLVGQEHVKNALGNALNNNRLHHAYLFTGTRGVGKTTIARIFAKSLNCEQGITATPCGQCSACLEIDAGNFVDLMEIDAASRTKVEDTRDLLDNVQYAPSHGRFKVYLIDEVHMLSKHSFNALLKTLEEPPPHVKFLLATTDPQKLPITVLSRCLQFNLLALSPLQIEQHLAYVLGEEAIPFEQAALAMLARAAKGSLRDSLSLTDQAIAQSNANITLDTVRTMLGFLDQSWAQLLLQAILAQDAQQLQLQLAALVQQQNHFSQVLDDMLSLLHLTALSQFSLSAAAFSPQQEFVQQLADTLAPAQVQLYYQLLISGKKELPFAPDPLTGLEMALLRAMAFQPETQDRMQTPAKHTRVGPVHVSPTNTSPTVTPSSVLPGASRPEQMEPPVEFAAQAEVAPAKSDITEPDVGVKPADDAMKVQAAAEQEGADQQVAEPVSGIDPVTARIMARRGVQVTPAPLTKKPERQQAPLTVKAPITSAEAVSDSTSTRGNSKGYDNDNTALQTQQTAQIVASQSARHAARQAAPQAAVDSTVLNPSNDDYDDADDTDIAQLDAAATDALWQQYEQDMQQAVSATPPTPEPVLAQFDGSINDQNFSIRFAAQVDAWAARVETLDTGGLSRLFLLNSAMQLNGAILDLTVAQSQQHLDSAGFRGKLQQVLELSFNQALTINVSYQLDVPNSPLSIQQKIVQERMVYVSRLLEQDENVLQLQQMFDAQLLAETIVVN